MDCLQRLQGNAMPWQCHRTIFRRTPQFEALVAAERKAAPCYQKRHPTRRLDRLERSWRFLGDWRGLVFRKSPSHKVVDGLHPGHQVERVLEFDRGTHLTCVVLGGE